MLGLSVGWGDVYRWQRPGMYVEFGGQPNGRYVVRSIVDAEHRVLETNDGDNVSYAYIEVQGRTIELLERGWGLDPWDPDKVVFDGPGPVQRSATAAGAAAQDSGGGGALPLLPLLLAGACAGMRYRRRRPVAPA